MSQPTLHYLELGRLGRGEVVRLFLRDAGIEFKDIRYPFDDTWPTTRADLKAKGITRTGSLPVLEYEGKTLAEHIPILRYLSRELGAYDGETSHEKYIVDAVSDVYIDWRAEWVASLAGVTDEFKNKVVPDYFNVISQYYAEREGPFLLGDKVTYADFAVYQSIDNNERTKTLPTLPENLVAFRKAFEARPRLAEYIASTRA